MVVSKEYLADLTRRVLAKIRNRFRVWSGTFFKWLGIARRKWFRWHYVAYALAAFLTFIAIFLFFIIKDLPSTEALGSRQIFESTKIYDRTGEVLLYEIHGEEKRTIIPFEEIPD